MLGLPMSTLRFWENHFPTINPRRNDRGTRFYTPRDIEAIRMIAYLVKDKGMKLEAAQEELKRNRDGVVKKFETVEKLKKSELPFRKCSTHSINSDNPTGQSWQQDNHQQNPKAKRRNRSRGSTGTPSDC